MTDREPQPETLSNLDRGFTRCECGKMASIVRADVAHCLPAEYDGELCATCKLWMCDVRYLEPPQPTLKWQVKTRGEWIDLIWSERHQTNRAGVLAIKWGVEIRLVKR